MNGETGAPTQDVQRAPFSSSEAPPSVEAMKAIGDKLDTRNTELGGQLFVPINSQKSDGTAMAARVFDGLSPQDTKDGCILLFVDGKGFRKISGPADRAHVLEAAIQAVRYMSEGGQNRFIGNVKPGHTDIGSGVEEFVLPDGVIARNNSEDPNAFHYSVATEEEIEDLLPSNVRASEKRHADAQERRKQEEARDPGRIAEKISPRLSQLLRSTTPAAPLSPQ